MSASTPTSSDLPAGTVDDERAVGDPAARGRREQVHSRGRRWAGVVVACLLILGPLVWDLGRPPAEQQTARWLLSGIALYQATLSPLLGRMGVRCRFRPTCSHYAAAAIRSRGAVAGSGRAIWRVLRCGPWTPAGTLDPP